MITLEPRERAMLAEMGVSWPQWLASGAPAPQPQSQSQPSSILATSIAATSAAVPVTQDLLARAVAGPEAGGIAPPPNWLELQEQVKACQRCGLCASRRSTVFGVGQPGAQWMIVGEAPGEQEDRLGEPFVGAAGRLLDQMLGAMGLARDPARGVFITNTIKCRPPQNRNPLPEELAACEPYLVQQMATVRPKIVLAMGRYAAQQLLGSDLPIGRLRGFVHPLPDRFGVPGVAVVVTYHPAYLLRNPIDKSKAWEDLALALDTLAQGQR